MLEVRVAKTKDMNGTYWTAQRGKHDPVSGRWKTCNLMAGLRSERSFCIEDLGEIEARQNAELLAKQWRERFSQ